MSAPADAAAPSLAAGRDLIRSAAKWFITGLGAIGAVLVAGSQVSSLGALAPGSWRLWIAALGVICGLAAVLVAMWSVVDILAGRLWTWDDVVAACRDPQPEGTDRTARRRNSAVRKWIDANPSVLGGYDCVQGIDTTYTAAEPDEAGIADLADLMSAITDKAATVDLDARWLRLRRTIAAGVAVGAAGVVVFAWAANPPPPLPQPPASLRSVSLRGANLAGASLRNADLTGADLTDADLRNADLQGAKVGGVTWHNTTCPDGTRSSNHGTARTESCEGHLLP